MNKEINLPSGNYLFVEVDEDCKPKQIAHNIVNKPNSLVLNHSVDLISTTKDITEEQAESIVEFKLETLYPEEFEPLTTGGFRNYEIYSSPYYNIQNAKESLQSLLQANDLDINKNYLILKRL